MFSLPSLPTDNLYKFIFIGGLICLVSSFFLLDTTIRSQIDDSKTVDSLRAVLDARTKASDIYFRNVNRGYKEDSVKLDEYKEETEDFKRSGIKDIDKAQNLKKNFDGLKTKLVKDRKANDSVRIENQLYHKQTDMVISELDSRQKKYDLNEDNAYFLLIIGSLFLLFGCGAWYWKTQSVQDEILGLTLKMAKIDYDIKLNSITPVPTASTEEPIAEETVENQD